MVVVCQFFFLLPWSPPLGLGKRVQVTADRCQRVRFPILGQWHSVTAGPPADGAHSHAKFTFNAIVSLKHSPRRLVMVLAFPRRIA